MALVRAQPPLQVEVVELFAPQHAGERLAMHAPLVLAERGRRDPLVELVGVADSAREDLIDVLEGGRWTGGREPHRHDLAATGRHVQHVVRRGLGPGLRRVHGFAPAPDHIVVERVLHVGRRIRLPPQPLGVALVLGEQQLRAAIARQPVLAQLGMHGADNARRGFAERRLRAVITPRPRVAEPERRQQAQLLPRRARDCRR